MAVAVVANDTQGGAPVLSVHRMKTQLERLEYLAEKMPWFSSGQVPQRENATCRYIRDHLFPLLDESQKKKVVIAQMGYSRAMGMVEKPDELRARIDRLGELLENAQKDGKIEGESLGAWEKARLEGEALALKKRGTAALKLFVAGSEDACICVAEKSLHGAVRRWERLGSASRDHAKALYRLALAKYGMGKDEEAIECARKCMEMCEGRHELDWLHCNAADVLAQARMEINRDLLAR
ncbi:MAG: tetratricopeptide repeat protein [Candidatus Micrarchaeia archaeon]|jgi:hypothetical protein